MKKSLISVLMVGVLGVALLAVACDGGSGGDKSKTPDTSGGSDYPSMRDVGGPAVKHSAADVAALTCLDKCHDSYNDRYDQTRVPTAGTWYSFVQKKYFTVVAGSAADHTNVTNAQCFNDKCHTRP